MVLVVLAVGVAPMGAAQAPACRIIGSDQGPVFLIPNRPGSVPLVLVCDGSQQPAAEYSASLVATSFPDYAMVSFEPPDVTVAGPGAFQAAFDMVVSVTPDAPAFEAGQYMISADVYGNPSNQLVAEAVGPANIQNGIWASLEAVPKASVIKAARGDMVKFAVDVRNLGNGQTRVDSEASQLDGEEVDAVFPSPTFVVDSKSSQGPAAVNQKTVLLTVWTPDGPAFRSSFQEFQLHLAASYAGQYPAGSQSSEDNQTILLSLEVTGGASPAAPMPAILVGFVVALSVASRRRRRGSVKTAQS